MRTSRIILAALAVVTIAFAAPADAGYHRNAQYGPGPGFVDAAAFPAYPTERRARTAHARSRAAVRRSRAVRTARHSPEDRQGLPSPSLAALPMGNSMPAFEANYPEQPDDVASYTDGLAYEARPTDVDAARAYLIKTAHVGGVMARMGRELYLAKLRGYAGSFNIFGVFKTALEAGNIEQIGVEQNVAALNPTFVLMAAKAIKDARARGLPVGLFSGYRPPSYGVGGFANKFDSCHTYAVAGDFWGVEKNYAVWSKAAREAGLHRPYASSWERNHWQAVPDKTCRELRSTVTASGPISLSRMWAAADRMIDRARGRTQFAVERRHERHAERRHHRRYRVANR